MNWEGLELSILGPACIAGLLVLSTHVPLGQQVLARGIIFIDLAIAQVAALGVILAQAMGVDEHGYGVEIAAALAALVGAALLTWTDRKWPDFQARWKAAIARWEKEAAPLRGASIVVQHKAFPYLERWLGLQELAALEPKPGVEPTSSHLSEVLEGLKSRPAKMIVRAAYNDGRGAEWLAERTRLPIVVLPFTVGGDAQAKDLFGLYDSTIEKLLAVAK